MLWIGGIMARKRYGAVVVFKEGVTKEEAERSLLKMADDAGYGALDNETYTAIKEGHCVEKFDPDEGSPVWYIP